MAIAVRASGSAVADVLAASTLITKPSGTQAGDLMVACVSFDQDIAGGVTSSAPAGWTAVDQNIGTAGTTKERTSVYYRVAQAGDTSWTFTISRTNSLGVAVQTFSGVDAVTPIDAVGTSSTNAGASTITANAVTVATPNAWHLIGAGTWTGATMSATGFTALNNASPATNEQCALLYNTTPKSTGSTGTVTVNGGAAASNTMSAIPFALRPAANLAITPFPGMPAALLAM